MQCSAVHVIGDYSLDSAVGLDMSHADLILKIDLV